MLNGLSALQGAMADGVDADEGWCRAERDGWGGTGCNVGPALGSRRSLKIWFIVLFQLEGGAPLYRITFTERSFLTGGPMM